MNGKYEDKIQRLICFEKEAYVKFMELLPQEVSVTDELNAYLKDVFQNPENEIRYSMFCKEELR